jgi:hypothetical protein
MIVSIHQPAYLPWLGYFDKILRSDLFIYFDTVQFERRSFQSRNFVHGEAKPTLLTVPVITSGQLYDTQLKDVQINNETAWRRKHAETIRHNYHRAPMFEPYWPGILSFYETEWTNLSELCFAMLTWFNEQFGIGTKIVKASALAATSARKSDLILNLCQQVGATEYISGGLGRDYLNLPSFAGTGIAIRFQDYQDPIYSQGGGTFQPKLAALDLLLHEPDAAQILRNGLAHSLSSA